MTNRFGFIDHGMEGPDGATSKVCPMIPEAAQELAQTLSLAEKYLSSAIAKGGMDEAFLDEMFGPIPSVTRSGNSAVVSLHGAIMPGASKIEQRMGVRDIDAFIADMREASADEDTDSIVLDVNTGGGSVVGIPEAAQAVAKSKKPVVAHVRGMAASAGYWIIAGADKIISTPESSVGSIGVYTYFFDTSESMDQMGIKVDVVTNTEGTFKAAGAFGRPLTKEQREKEVSSLDQMFALFKGHITKARPFAPASVMKGQLLTSGEAKKKHLIDDIGFTEHAFSVAENYVAKSKR